MFSDRDDVLCKILELRENFWCKSPKWNSPFRTPSRRWERVHNVAFRVRVLIALLAVQWRLVST